MTRRCEIANRSRDAYTFAPVARPRADAGRVRIVVIQDLFKAGLACGFEEGAIQGLPGLATRPLYPDRTADAVKIAARIAVVFELPMKRQDLLETPFAITPGRPFIKILRCAAKRDMA